MQQSHSMNLRRRGATDIALLSLGLGPAFAPRRVDIVATPRLLGLTGALRFSAPGMDD